MSEGKAGKRLSGHSPRRRLRHKVIYQGRKEAKAKGDFRNKAEGSSVGEPTPAPARRRGASKLNHEGGRPGAGDMRLREYLLILFKPHQQLWGFGRTRTIINHIFPREGNCDSEKSTVLLNVTQRRQDQNPWSLCQRPGVSRTMHLRLGGFNNKYLLSHNSGDWKAESKVWVGLVSPETSLRVEMATPLCVFKWPSLCRAVS